MPVLGSFRDALDFKDLLPDDVKRLLFNDDVIEDINQLSFDLNPSFAHLNHGSFGAAFRICTELSTSLRTIAEEDPAVFYDKLICPLLRYSLSVISRVLKSSNVVLIPNLTIGLKNLLECLLQNSQKQNIAVLEPIYGATRKLLKEFLPKRYKDVSITTVSPGMFEEDPNVFIECLNTSFNESPFDYLVADHVTSQSTRILPINEVIEWCNSKNVILIVDGTQSADIILDKYPSYYLFSTQKWLSNVKTCGVLRCEDNVQLPEPVGISFGYNEDIESSHLWQGLQDYFPHIVLSLALRIYEKHGITIRTHASEILSRKLNEIGLPPVLPDKSGVLRLMNLVEINRFDDNAIDNFNLQDCFDMRDVRISSKVLEGKQYLRISSYLYSKDEDFEKLGDIIDYKLSYQDITKEKLIHEFLTMTRMYDALFEPLIDNAFFVRAEPLRHHLIFYYGHTAVFYINKLVLQGILKNSERIDTYIESSCAVGVDEMSWDDLSESNYPWSDPKERDIFISKVQNYRNSLRTLIVNLIQGYNFNKKSFTQFELPWIILMGIEHERIHIETSACIIHQLEPKYLDIDKIPSQFNVCPKKRSNPSDVPKNNLIKVNGGDIEMGRNDSEHPEYFGWDNEFGKESASLNEFQVSQMLVSNAEYLEFINDGGYETEEYWNEDSWAWVCKKERKQPLSWIEKGKKLRTLYTEIDMPWDWPVEVIAFEADAFCKWKSKQLNQKISLISHEEWYLLRQRMNGKNYNYNIKKWGSTCPVDTFGEKANDNGDILYDISGNLWQHSRSALTLLQQGFHTHPAYDDFTTPTIDGKHFFLLGGSWISCGDETNLSGRYGFRKHFQQFAGIRYVISNNSYHDKISPYYMGREDSVPITDHYLDFTRKTFLDEQPLPNWFSWFGQYAAKFIPENSSNLNVAMINGSVGRITLEFIKNSKPGQLENVLHADLSATRLRVLESLVNCGMIRWDQFIEGDLVENHYFHLKEHNLEVPSGINISYRQLDTNNIDPKFFHHDFVLIDSDSEMVLPVQSISTSLVKAGGILVLASIGKVESIPGYEVIENDIENWKITRDTGRKSRVVKINVSVWKRTDVATEDLPKPKEEEGNRNDDELYYESKAVVDSYEKFHFGPGYLGVPNFSKAVADFGIEVAKKHNVPLNRALDIGSGPGRTAIELTSAFKHVCAIDFSVSFIELCKKHIPEYPIPQGHELKAIVGDAHDLISEEKYDLVVAINLIDRLETPKKFLDGIKPLISDRGILIIASPYTWMDKFTEHDKWLGGFMKWGETQTTENGLKEALSPEFELLEPPTDIPFVIPDPDNSYQYTLSNATVFGRTNR